MCTWRCGILPGNTGKGLCKEVGDSLRICHRPPTRQQDWRGRRRILPSNSADFVEYICKRGANVNGRDIGFPGSCASLKTRRSRARLHQKASKHCGSPRCRRRLEKAARFSLTVLMYAAFLQGMRRLVKLPDVLRTD
ncbi:hypothetical protein E2C01_032422 [Portunus trituberculatus]|uniref:Uncharacterized protein n=1 Tax=Portunus trituberculatus TaxID=210409 RepID=A0A5B7EZK7_PORTR|nr:hypothetical protein [Portunus trituberculatus]